MNNRTAVIGDTHGCAKTLQALLKKLQLERGDALVPVGDYVDRGPDSRGVITRYLAEKKRGVKIYPLLGNHDAMLIALLCLSKKWRARFPIRFPGHFWQSALIPGNGLIDTADAYGWDWPLFREPGYQSMKVDEFFEMVMKLYCSTDYLKFVLEALADKAEMPKSHVKFFQSMRFCYHDSDLDVLVVHAELPLRSLRRTTAESAMRAISRQDAFDSVLWGRKYFNRTPRFSTPIIHGHSQLKHHPLYAADETMPRMIKGKMDLDTGAASGGLLSALVLPEWKIVQQENLDQ